MPLKTRPGVSIVIALMIVLGFMIMMASVMQTMSRTQNIAKGAKFADQAMLNAQLGLEIGLYKQNNPKEFGNMIKAMNGGNDLEVPNTLTLPGGSTVNWQVSTDTDKTAEVCMETTIAPDSNVANCKDDKYYVYPFPGTGTVGGKDCDITTQEVRKNKSWLEQMYLMIYKNKYDSSKTAIDASQFALLNGPTGVANMTTLDNPCLWNKLSVGQSAEVPLFRIKDDGQPTDPAALTDFVVRARMPCKNGGACLEGEREVLVVNTSKYGQLKNVRALIWNISADCSKGPVCYISEQGDSNPTPLSLTTMSTIRYSYLSKNSSFSGIINWILGFKQNQKQVYAVDGEKDQHQGPIQKFLTSADPWGGFSISKPYFHLSIAGPLPINQAGDQTVDNIEYQILYKQDLAKGGTQSFITNPSVISRGTSGGYTTTLQSSLTKQTGAFNFSFIGN